MGVSISIKTVKILKSKITGEITCKRSDKTVGTPWHKIIILKGSSKRKTRNASLVTELDQTTLWIDSNDIDPKTSLFSLMFIIFDVAWFWIIPRCSLRIHPHWTTQTRSRSWGIPHRIVRENLFRERKHHQQRIIRKSKKASPTIVKKADN